MAKVMKELSEKEKLDRSILNTLAELGGRRVGAENIEFGTGWVLPQQYKDDLDGAIHFLIQYKESMEEPNNFARTFPYRPWDGAVAVMRAFEKNFGTKGISGASFFEMPEMVSVPIGVDEFVQVMWGKVRIPVFRGVMKLGSVKDDEGNLLFSVQVTTPKKFEGAVEGLFKMIKDELETNSIYRGKAFDGAQKANFLDLSKYDAEKIVFNKVTRLQLKANIWTPIMRPEECRANGIDPKRAVQLYGPYGTGKTMIGLETAIACQSMDRTFIMCNPKDNNVFQVLDTAAMYQPATVFIEDIDHLAGAEQDQPTISQMLDKYDGLKAKGLDLMVVMTTNHVERIHKGMLRPGRLDAVIKIDLLDREATERLIRALFKPEELHPDLDMDAIFEAMEGFAPAFVKETCEKVKLYSIAREDEDTSTERFRITKPSRRGRVYTTDVFLGSAKEMRDHHDLHNQAGEGTPTPTLDRAMHDAVLTAIDGRVNQIDEDEGRNYGTLKRIDR